MRAFETISRLTFVAVLAAGALASRASAQCGPDNLDTLPCCSPLSATLPTFPAITQQGRYVCFNSCATAVNQQVCVTINAPVPANSGGPICGVYIIRFTFRLCGSGNIIWQGNMRAQYARNWLEGNSATRYGVWRFLLNGDLSPTAIVPNVPNAKPPCVANFANRAYFSGYVDYALDCSTPNTWFAAFALNHDCDKWTHAAGTGRVIGGGSHAARSYVFMGPSAGFNVDPANGPWITGSGAGEAMRTNDWPAVPNICRAEEIILAPAAYIPQTPMCQCLPGALSPTQFNETVIQVQGACGSRFDTSNPPIGPFPFAQKAIGYWTIAGTFPSQAHLFIDHGTMLHGDACTSTATTEFMEGVTTLTGGVTLQDYAGNPLGNNLVDLGSSNGVGGAVQIARPHVVWYLMGMNF
ncbi:MAG: hypothetical protein HY292_26205 [Planctomycetes bacterium]|nr:hypothetical protein [Planctomycetota bacterium]